MASRGLGDDIERMTKLLGIKAIAEAYTEATGKDCGCGKRRDALNELVPYKNE